MAIKGGITLIQKLQKLFGARAVSDMMGRTTNVQTLAKGTNNPFANTFSRKYLAKNEDGVEEASRVILENMQYAFGNKNIQQMKNFEYNVDTLYNMKFPATKKQADIIDIKTKSKVDESGIMQLKDDLGLPEGVSPDSPMGKSMAKTKREDMGTGVTGVKDVVESMFGTLGKKTKMSEQGAKAYSANIESFRRPIIRQMLLKDTRINLPKDVRESLLMKNDLQRGADPKMDPLRLLNEYYDVDFNKLDQLEEIRFTARNETEAADEFLQKGGLKPKKPVVKESLDNPDDDIPFAQGGRAGYAVGGLSKLLKMLQDNFGKKAITTANKLSRPETALNREMFGEFNKRMNRQILEVPPMPGGFKLSKEKLLKNYPEIDESFADEIMAMDKELQGRIIKMIEDRRKDPKAYDKLLKEKGDTLDFQGEFDRSVQRSKNADGGIAGQLHLNQGGRVGLQEGGLPTVKSVGGVPNVEGGRIVYDLGNGSYIYESPYGYEVVENGIYTSLGSKEYSDGSARPLKHLFEDGIIMRRANDPILLEQQAQSAKTAAPTIAAPTIAAPTIAAPTIAAPTPTGIQTTPGDKKVFNVMMDEKGNVQDDQSLLELFRKTGTAPQIGIGGPASINSMSDVFRLAGITGEDGISMGTDYSGTTLPSGGIANTLPVEQRMQAASAKGLDARMGRTYEENIQAMADPRMRTAQMPIDIMPPLSNEFNESGKTFAQGNYKNEAEAIADLGIERYNQLFNMGGRVGLEKGGPPNKGRRNFMKLLAGLASLPIVGKLFKGAKVAEKVVQLKNTTTTMPAWFPKFIDKVTYSGVGKKIDADIMLYEPKELPGIKVYKQDDGKIFVEGKNDYSKSYEIEYEPPGYEVVDYKTGKAVKTKGNFTAQEEVPVNVDPDGNADFDAEVLESVDNILSSDARTMEEFATGKKIKEMKRGEFEVGRAESLADSARKGENLDDFAKGGLAGQLKL